MGGDCQFGVRDHSFPMTVAPLMLAAPTIEGAHSPGKLRLGAMQTATI
ncbi:hypothetical protein JOH51_006585 [Rhizobium leguminosarum]|nr:hypothetical protein [Rhizobium leguminosarum]